mgnify:CR=1 FL=1
MRQVALVVVVTLALFFVEGCTSSTNSELEKRKAQVEKFMTYYETGDESAKDAIMEQQSFYEDYPSSDVSGFCSELVGQCKVEVLRIIADDKAVFAQTLLRGREANYVSYDLFVFAEGGVLQHWYGMERLPPTDPEGKFALGGDTQVKDLDKTEANKALVSEFAQLLYEDFKHSTLGRFFDNGKLIRHQYPPENNFEAYMAEQLIPYNPTDALEEAPAGLKVKVLQVIGEGNFVMVAHTISYLFSNPYETLGLELFRVENGKIVEVWSIQQELQGEERGDYGEEDMEEDLEEN